MEILLLYRAISKHCIKIAANDRVTLGKLCNKCKAAWLHSCSARHANIGAGFLSGGFGFREKNPISIIKRADRKLTTYWYLFGMHAIRTYQ